MKQMTRYFSLLVLVLLLICSQSELCLAQRLMYLDKSGNIHFVDSLAEVPNEYREQLVTPTPGPKTMKEYKKLTREIQKSKREKLKVVQKQSRLVDQQKKKMAREIEKEKKKQKMKEAKAAKAADALAKKPRKKKVTPIP